MNIRTKLFLLLCFISIIPLAIVGFISLNVSKNALEKHIGIKSLEFAHISMKRLNEYLYSKYGDIKKWSAMDEIKTLARNEKIDPKKQRVLKILSQNNDDYYYLAQLNKKGIIIASSNPQLIGTNLSNDDGFKISIKGETHIQDVRYNKPARGYAIVFSAPITVSDKKNSPQGVFISALKWNKINKMNADLEILGKKQNVFNHIMLTNKDGLIISCDNPQQIFTNNLIKTGMQSARLAQDGKEGYLTETSNHGYYSFATYTYFKHYRDMPNPNWLLVLLQEPKSLFASVEALQKILILIIITTIFVSFGLSLAFAGNISNPIVNIASAAQAIGSGNLDKRVHVDSKGEIGILGRSFNKMADDLKRSRDELVLTKDYVNNIITSMVDILIVIDEKGEIQTVNNAACEVLGYSEKEFTRTSVDKIFYSNTKDESGSSWIRLLLKKGPSYQGEGILLSKDKKKIPVSISASVMKKNSLNIQGIVCVAKDLTEKKRAEEAINYHHQQLIQADKMASLGILVSGVAHEINNPNNFIQFNITTLKKVWNGALPVLKEYYEENGDFALGGFEYTEARYAVPKLLEGISTGSTRIKQIVLKLKGFSRQNISGHTKLVDVNKVVESAIFLVDSLIKHSTNNFFVHYQNDLPKLRGNFQELEQVAVNLLTNSCQALTDKNKSIRISTGYDRVTKQITIQTIDEGAGIHKENFNKILEPFFTTKREEGGTGLGLSVSFGIVKDHGGELKFSSKRGVGTTAAVILPVT